MKIKLDTPIKSLGGETYKTADKTDITLGGVIAEVLVNAQEGGKMKLYTLAQRAFTEKEIEIDSSDLTLIKKAVETSNAYNGNAIILGQTLELLENVK